MSSERPHLTLLGVPVRVEWTFWIIAVLLGIGAYSGGLLVAWVAVVFVSILVHEFGHALVLRAYEQKPRVVLLGMGGVTFGSAPHRNRAESIIVSVAGPLTALILLGIPAYLLQGSVSQYDNYNLYEVLGAIAFVNIFWSLANLAPILPLDGGNVCAALIGLKPARIVSVVIAGAGALWMLSVGYEFGALFAVMFAVMNIAALQETPTRSRSARGLMPLDLGTLQPRAADGRTLTPDEIEGIAWQSLHVGDAATARAALSHAPDPTMVSRFLTGSLALAEGRVDDGLAELTAAYLSQPTGPASLVPAIVVARAGVADELARRLLTGPAGAQAAHGLQTHLHYADCFADSARVGALVYSDGRVDRAKVAFEIACATSRGGDPRTALAWVERSLADGFLGGSLLDTEPDLAAVRALPAWPSVRARAAQR
jgi:Zn-dependent protease